MELMVGMALGLMTTVAVTEIMMRFEGQKQTTVAVSDAQVNLGLALHTLRQDIQMAGYGFSMFDASLGCPLSASYKGAPIAGFPAALAPVQIVDGGANSQPDAVRVLYSSKSSFAVPIQLAANGYAVGAQTVPVASVNGVQSGDLLAFIPKAAGGNCSLVQVTAAPAAASGSAPFEITMANNAWNPSGFPAQAYPKDSVLANLGELTDITYTADGASAHLLTNRLELSASQAPSYTGWQEIYGNVVNLQAYYGRDTDLDGAVDEWTTVSPVSNEEWKQLLAIRLALVVRIDQFERSERQRDGTRIYTTASNLLWDMGAKVRVVDNNADIISPCGQSSDHRCVLVRLDTLPDWQNYRYRLLETVIPLRNFIWKAS